jgi:hypothetical protein
MSKVSVSQEQTVITPIESTPKSGLLLQGNETQMNDFCRELVHVLVEHSRPSPGMLVIRMSGLVTGVPSQIWHIHAVIVDQFEPATDNQDVAVLQISVGYMIRTQRGNHGQELRVQIRQKLAVANVFPHISIQRDSIHPVHHENRVPGATDPNPLNDIVEINRIWQSHLIQVAGDASVSLLLVIILVEEALDSMLL